jgi:hypothetical protein
LTLWMEDRIFVLIDSGMPGDRDSLYFLQDGNFFQFKKSFLVEI